MPERSKLVRMRISNFGCIGIDGLSIELDRIVCLVGTNNTGKTTVLRAYEAVLNQSFLKQEDFHLDSRDKPAHVEIWVHIPNGAGNVDEKWKEKVGALLLVRSKWEWPAGGGKPTRKTWDPESRVYADEGNASGLDNVFNSRLPKPFRIGALEDPQAEHANLMGLVIQPVLEKYADLMKDKDSEIRIKIEELQAVAEKPVNDFKEKIEAVQKKVNSSYQNIFSSSEIKLTIGLGKIDFKPDAYLKAGSHVSVNEKHGETKWDQQGTGSQRALFWSMLQVRTELNRVIDLERGRQKTISDLEKKKGKLEEKGLTALKGAAKLKNDDELEKCKADLESAKKAEGEEAFLPGHMLLIDEPETALHPAAIRAAREHLYALAEDAGWQVMLTTHCPSFVDPLKDHTTIVRLHRPSEKMQPNIYRADEVQFSADEKENLKFLLAFDSGIAEMFFGSKPLLVEGDTESAAFLEVLNSKEDEFPYDKRPTIVRARGKATLPLLIKMLDHFKVDFSLLHDIDSPKTSKGAVNPAFTVNGNIRAAVQAARANGRKVLYLTSCTNFEVHFGLQLPKKEKPYEAWKAVRGDKTVQDAIFERLKLLVFEENSAGKDDDGMNSEKKLGLWIKTKILENDIKFKDWVKPVGEIGE